MVRIGPKMASNGSKMLFFLHDGPRLSSNQKIYIYQWVILTNKDTLVPFLYILDKIVFQGSQGRKDLKKVTKEYFFYQKGVQRSTESSKKEYKGVRFL